ncbi:MAG: hypothetical protein IJ649_11030 [Oscillospiraceae bacterium]|nr:hypothetical protein [Oscillospiraceae bacterium]
MTKQEFIAKYVRLNATQQAELMAYYVDVYKSAVFPETLAEAERRIAWMRETSAKHSAR